MSATSMASCSSSASMSARMRRKCLALYSCPGSPSRELTDLRRTLREFADGHFTSQHVALVAKDKDFSLQMRLATRIAGHSAPDQPWSPIGVTIWVSGTDGSARLWSPRPFASADLKSAPFLTNVRLSERRWLVGTRILGDPSPDHDRERRQVRRHQHKILRQPYAYGGDLGNERFDAAK